MMKMTTRKPTTPVRSTWTKGAKKDPATMSFGEQLIEGLKEVAAFEQGKISLRVIERRITARQATVIAAPQYPPARVKRLRKTVKLSQPVFADALNVDADTVRAWEQGRRQPSGPALRLLELTELHPEWVLAAVRAR
jgi:putative transcriptional regulator